MRWHAAHLYTGTTARIEPERREPTPSAVKNLEVGREPLWRGTEGHRPPPIGSLEHLRLGHLLGTPQIDLARSKQREGIHAHKVIALRTPKRRQRSQILQSSLEILARCRMQNQQPLSSALVGHRGHHKLA